MLPPIIFFGDFHHSRQGADVPEFIRRDFDNAPLKIRMIQKRRLRIPVWPGFRLHIHIERVAPAGGLHV